MLKAYCNDRKSLNEAISCDYESPLAAASSLVTQSHHLPWFLIEKILGEKYKGLIVLVNKYNALILKIMGNSDF